MTGRLVRRAYTAPACHVGEHARCDKGTIEVSAVPGVQREGCACACHGEDGPGRHQAAGSPVGLAKTVPSGAAP